jgi:hypothetical protein
MCLFVWISFNDLLELSVLKIIGRAVTVHGPDSKAIDPIRAAAFHGTVSLRVPIEWRRRASTAQQDDTTFPHLFFHSSVRDSSEGVTTLEKK